MKYFLTVFSLFAFIIQMNAQQLHSDSIDVLHYHIQITEVNYSETSIQGHTILKIVPKQNNTSHFSLDLQSLTCDSIKLNSDLLAFTHNDTILNISLINSIHITDTILLSVFYHGNPQPDPQWGGFYFMNNYSFNLGVAFEDIPHNYGRIWFPCVDDFIDRAIYDFSITTKTNQLAVCNGLLTDIDTIVTGIDTSLIHHWHLSDEIPTYLACMSVGPYELFEWTYEGLERDIPVQIYMYPGDSADVAGSFANLDTTTRIFETLFGPYEWQKIGYTIVPFNNGAMEHATSIAIGNGFITGNLDWETLISHELFHHWFGDYITCQKAEEMWINEGWAKYSETVSTEFIYGKRAGRDYRRSHHKDAITTAHSNDGDFYAINAVPQNVTYGTTSYYKGASVVHSLRDYMGDESFFPAVREMLEEKAFQDISSEEMRDILSDNSGMDLTDFFDNWVFKPGFPHYKLDSFHVINNGTNFDIHVWVKQQLYGRNTYSDGNKVNVCFVDSDYKIYEEKLEFDGETGYGQFNIDFNPLMVALDINEATSDAKVSDYDIIKNTGSNYYSEEYLKIDFDNITDSAFLYVSHHWGQPDSMKTPIEGLILANHRYWHVDGDFPDGFEISGNFYYSVSTNGNFPVLDGDFVTNSLDSLRLMYRANPQSDWEIVEGQTNSTFMKVFLVDQILPGEYTLAIYDWDEYHNVEMAQNIVTQVYPNPASNQVFIEANNQFDGHFYVLNQLGHEIVNGQLNHNRNRFIWNIETAPGLYFIVFIDKFGNQKTEKIIIQ
jgi:hypothetical protein